MSRAGRETNTSQISEAIAGMGKGRRGRERGTRRNRENEGKKMGKYRWRAVQYGKRRRGRDGKKWQEKPEGGTRNAK